ncbi:MAG: site-specific integrase [Synechococcus sp. BS307-5m-G38]|nr:site-specific integrase [Synechococcus sp. BS307-5m-G38]
MPRVVHQEPWVVGLRAVVRSSTAKGWGVLKAGDNVRLQVRGDGVSGSVCLPFRWESGSVGDVQQRVRNIYVLVCDGYTLQDAAERAETASASSAIDWSTALKDFKGRVQGMGTQVSEKTWKEGYKPFLEEAVRLLEGRMPPTTAFKLAESMLAKWPNVEGKNYEARKKGVNALTRFLDHCIEKGLPSASWTLTKDQKLELKGQKNKTAEKGTLRDEQMLELLEIVSNKEWRNALMLLMTYGLRPVELKHLEARRHTRHGLQMWCSYRKACGKHKTEPRWLKPVPPKGASWGDLCEQMSEGKLTLPPLNTPSAVNQYLRRKKQYEELKQKCQKSGEWITPYVFRNSYSYRCHQKRIAPHRICAAMGHSLLVHQQNYVWAREDTVFDDFGDS